MKWILWSNCEEYGVTKFDERILGSLSNCRDLDIAVVDFPKDYFKIQVDYNCNLEANIISIIQHAIDQTELEKDAADLLGISQRRMSYYLNEKYPQLINRKDG